MILAERTLERVRNFTLARKEIRQNQNLSPVGMERALGNLEESVQVFYPDAVKNLEGEWNRIRERDRENLERVVQLNSELEGKWNFSRLQYEQVVMAERLSSVKSPGELAEVWNQVQTGTPERQRAFLELAVSKSQTFQGGDGKNIHRTLERELARLTTSPELEKAKQAGSVLVEDAVKLQKITNEVAGFYYPPMVFSGENPFQKMTEGIVIKERVIPETWETITTLDILEPETMTGNAFSGSL